MTRACSRCCTCDTRRSAVHVLTRASRCAHRLLSDALELNLADIAALNLIYSSGVDLNGHPVIVFIAAHVPAPKVDLRRVLMYIVRVRGHPSI